MRLVPVLRAGVATALSAKQPRGPDFQVATSEVRLGSSTLPSSMTEPMSDVRATSKAGESVVDLGRVKRVIRVK